MRIVMWRKWRRTKIGIIMSSRRKRPLIRIRWERIISWSRRRPVGRREVIEIWGIRPGPVIEPCVGIELPWGRRAVGIKAYWCGRARGCGGVGVVRRGTGR